MVTHSKTDVMTAFGTDGIVPIFHHDDLDVAKAVASAVVGGGLGTLEFTNRADGALGLFAELRRWTTAQLPRLVLGLGSVIDAETAVAAMNSGADFIFGPSLSAEVAAACNSRNVPYVPGCGTVTEIQAAYRLGCDLVKLFPAASLGGPDFLTAVRAPCPWIQAIPTGGVSPTVESLRSWFDAGAPAVGLGSRLFDKTSIDASDFTALEQAVSQAVDAVARARR